MTAPVRPRRWREVQRRPVRGNSPNDRIYVVRIVIVPREFAPMSSPPLRHRGFRESRAFPACVFQA
jgi:hypothetical protein